MSKNNLPRFCGNCKLAGKSALFSKFCGPCYYEADENGNRTKPNFKHKHGTIGRPVRNGRSGRTSESGK
jgi:hypothetical protein